MKEKDLRDLGKKIKPDEGFYNRLENGLLSKNISEKRNSFKRTALLAACLILIIAVITASVVFTLGKKPTAPVFLPDESIINIDSNYSSKNSDINTEITDIILSISSASNDTSKNIINDDNKYLKSISSYKMFNEIKTENIKIGSGNYSLPYFTFEEFEKFFFEYRQIGKAFLPLGDDSVGCRYLIMKGKRLSTNIYLKYMGYTPEGERDLRTFRLTKVQITDIIQQKVTDKTTEYKINDIVAVYEPFTLPIGDTKADLNKATDNDFIYFNAPINDKDEYLLYLRLPKEPITVGSEHFGYEKLQNVFFIWGFFDINDETKTFTSEKKAKKHIKINYVYYLYPDILEKYYGIKKDDKADISTEVS